MPTRPEDTLLLLVGPNPTNGFDIDEVAAASRQLQALGYRIIYAHDISVGAKTLPVADGVARTEHWYESHDASLMVDAAEALGKPVLSPHAWARAIGPGARGWYEELFVP